MATLLVSDHLWSLGVTFHLNNTQLTPLIENTFSYGHTHQTVPGPVRSPKSNWWRRRQYCGGGPHGNTTCCSFLIFVSPTLWKHSSFVNERMFIRRPISQKHSSFAGGRKTRRPISQKHSSSSLVGEWKIRRISQKHSSSSMGEKSPPSMLQKHSSCQKNWRRNCLSMDHTNAFFWRTREKVYPHAKVSKAFFLFD